jgi:hypothetical protein
MEELEKKIKDHLAGVEGKKVLDGKVDGKKVVEEKEKVVEK